MARMTAARAAVEILRREGVTGAFGVPARQSTPSTRHSRPPAASPTPSPGTSRRAAQMAEGYTRTRPGNIGVCVGTSGAAGTDMITGLYSATGDSIPASASPDGPPPR